MTEEELREEATSTVEWESVPMIDRPLFVFAYVKGALTREKRIEELEKEIKDNEDLATVAYMQGAEQQKKKSEKQLTKAIKLLKILLENYVSEPEVFSDGSCEDNELLNLINEIKQFINNEGEINDG